MGKGMPVISVDTKKKELIGRFKNGGRQWRPKGNPERVNVHDFLDKKKGKAIPYGVYELGRNGPLGTYLHNSHCPATAFIARRISLCLRDKHSKCLTSPSHG